MPIFDVSRSAVRVNCIAGSLQSLVALAHKPVGFLPLVQSVLNGDGGTPTGSLDVRIYETLILDATKRKGAEPSQELVLLQKYIDRCGIKHVPGIQASADFFNLRVQRIPARLDVPTGYKYPRPPHSLHPDALEHVKALFKGLLDLFVVLAKRNPRNKPKEVIRGMVFLAIQQYVGLDTLRPTITFVHMVDAVGAKNEKTNQMSDMTLG